MVLLWPILLGELIGNSIKYLTNVKSETSLMEEKPEPVDDEWKGMTR